MAVSWEYLNPEPLHHLALISHLNDAIFPAHVQSNREQSRPFPGQTDFSLCLLGAATVFPNEQQSHVPTCTERLSSAAGPELCALPEQGSSHTLNLMDP